jgi:tetratricopeptide (TPR) repeat protein
MKIVDKKKKEKIRVINKVLSFIDESDWAHARKYLKKRLLKDKNSTWLLANISSTYYEEKKYDIAYRYISEAFLIESEDPFVLWHLASVFDMLGKKIEAIVVWEKIMEMGVQPIIDYEYSPSLDWSESLYNDVKFVLGFAYLKNDESMKGINMLIDYLKGINSGIQTMYNVEEAKKIIAQTGNIAT